MSSFANFSQFIRHGGQASITLSLRAADLPLELKQSSLDPASVAAFEERLRELAAENWSGITAALWRAGIEADPAAEDIEAEIGQARATYSDQASAILSAGDPSVSEADLATLSDWLARRFLTEINERRQRDLGVTHYIWRSLDDPRVRTAHAERDDRLFSWDDRFSDGHPGHGYNCRCTAEPAILDGAILLTEVTLSEGLSNRIADAQGAGLADAAADAAAGGVETLYSTIRFSWLGYRRLFGVSTPEEEAERLAMRAGLIRTIDTIITLDAETARSMAEAFVDCFDARHADLRLLDLEHRLGLVPEESLLRACRQVAYLDASVTLGATALTTVASRLGIGVARLRPRDAIVALRTAAARYDGMIGMRRATVVSYVSRRFADLSTQGHGPQRHEGAVTRAMLEARVLRGIDPMTGTRIDGETGGRHRAPRAASRFTSPEAFVAAENHVRSTPEYRAARDAALFDPAYQRGAFEVVVRIEDALGLNLLTLVEGVIRIGHRGGPEPLAAMDFDGGLVIARFRIAADGESQLVTMLPVGRRE
ncbi:MAG: minor capsid protein [Rhodobacter sp.]|nr:minor capsid protein [Rhodobacter sp.]